ncbi:MAG: hypothetical protein ACJAS1_004246 [Oleiphilaceae bacterium]|jgi:hypothetical protein
MLKIKRLYSEPKIFEPIIFEDGFNLIVGETSEGNDKTNGVGKSLTIEFLNYGLLKRHSDSRVALIPKKELPEGLTICLDFEINNNKITSRRSVVDHECPTLIINGKSKSYSTLSDASDHLTTLLFDDINQQNPPSFRIMMGPLIRDEGSEFKSIINCYDTNKRIPPNYTPHLYLLHIDPLPYLEAKTLYTEISDIGKARKKMEENIETITGKDVSESKAELNELKRQVEKIQSDIDKLENVEGFDAVKGEIIDIETQLEQQRSEQGVLKSELSRIELFRGDNYINEAEVAELYNQFREGLGDLIRREIEEVVTFKRKIDDFQRTIIDVRRSSLEEGISVLDKTIYELNRKYKDKIGLLDQEGLLISLKQTIAIHQRKVEELSSLSTFIKKHADYDSDHKSKKRERDNKVYLLESYKNDAKDVTDSFQRTVLDIHEYVYGNRKGSFDIDVSKTAEILKFELRADSDGSHSINREIVFLYDLSLLLNTDTSKHHPRLLVHDNIFDVDQSTLINSLNYIGDRKNQLSDKQYILTINSDKLSEEDKNCLNFNISDYERASFTKSKRFLSFNYQELSKIKKK